MPQQRQSPPAGCAHHAGRDSRVSWWSSVAAGRGCGHRRYAGARLRPRRRWTAPPRAGLPGDVPAPCRLGTALERTLRLASPIRPPWGTAVSTGAAALYSCHRFLPPRNPLEGTLRIADRSWRSTAVPLLSLVLCGLFSLLASVWNVMPQGSRVKARPRGAHQQDGHRGLATSAGLACARDRRRTRVPDAARAWAGGQRGGSVPL